MSRPFRTAAAYYPRYRPGYPPELIARLAEAAGVDRQARVLDLGCGPGSLAIPLAAYAREVVAVDAEPEMIAELQRAAPANVTAVEGRAEDVDERWGSFRLATVGRAIHWFDAPLVLDNLARLTSTVALCADDSRDSVAQTLALSLARELIDEPPSERSKPGFRYEEILRSSPFSEVEIVSVEVERTWTADELIGFAYSTSSASVERLGDRRAEFERRLREQAKSSYRERVGVDAVIGRRP
ncbi:MAG TPA: class I SAM-dependent methyltransferase [Gaiellaceae bacterium]|nr:class I SAM-dependent methyltransferase [Gaiellaceae bacterium]